MSRAELYEAAVKRDDFCCAVECADFAWRSKDGLTALMLAALYRSRRVLMWQLLTQPLETRRTLDDVIGERNPCDGNKTALMYACTGRDDDPTCAVMLLTHMKAPEVANLVCDARLSAAHYAAQWGLSKTLDQVLALRPDLCVHGCDCFGRTPTTIATSRGDAELSRKLSLSIASLCESGDATFKKVLALPRQDLVDTAVLLEQRVAMLNARLVRLEAALAAASDADAAPE